MNYGTVSSNLNSSVSKINDSKMLIKNIDFDSNWSGSAHDTLVISLEKVLKELDTVKTDLSTFSGALSLLDVYIAKLGQIEKLQLQLDGLDPEDSRDRVLYDSITLKINTLRTEIKELEDAINAILSSFGVFSGQYSVTNSYSYDQLKEMSLEFKKLRFGSVIKNLVGKTVENGMIIQNVEEAKAYIENRISSVKRRYTGNDRNFMVTMEAIDICFLAGVRPSYEHHGTSGTGKTEADRTAVPVTVFNHSDCNAFVSYILFDETTTTKWLEVQQYYDPSLRISDEEAVGGDLFSSYGHIGIVMANDPENDKVLIFHSGLYGGEEGWAFQERSYSNLDGIKSHMMIRMDSTYVSPRLQELLDK